MIGPVRLSRSWVLLAATVPGLIAGPHASLAAASRDCRHEAAALREQLESVIEATIDGKTAGVSKSAVRVSGWWSQHRDVFSVDRSVDDLMRALVDSARVDPKAAARIGVQISAWSLGWCPGGMTLDDRVMLLDLAGMAGWLRANGVTMDWPEGVRDAAETIAARLDQRKQTRLSSRLRASVAATLAIPNGAKSDARPAHHLLDLVDEVEKAIL